MTASQGLAVKRKMHTVFKVELDTTEKKQSNIMYTSLCATRGCRSGSREKANLPQHTSVKPASQHTVKHA